MNPVEIGGILHVRKSDMEIAYMHDELGKALYQQNVEAGYIVEDLA